MAVTFLAEGVLHTNSSDMETDLLDQIEWPLDQVPEHLWSTSPASVGLIKGDEPVIILPKSDQRPYVRQYQLKPEAEAGITPIVQSLLSS